MDSNATSIVDAPLVDGLVLIDKPQGMTSQRAVSRVKKLLGVSKAGHAGTLDPMATGLLVVGIGKATRLLGYLTDKDKQYIATIRLGQATTTDDAEGELIGTPVDATGLTNTAIAMAISRYVGHIEQVPSTVSAIKVNGKRAYTMARAGEEVVLKARPVTVAAFTVQKRTDCAPWVDLDVTVDCTSGTYIRALARDLGRDLGVGGHLIALRRMRVGDLSVNDAIGVEQVRPRHVSSMGQVASHIAPRVDVDERTMHQIAVGRSIPVALDVDLAAVFCGSRLLALYKPDPQDPSHACPVAVFIDAAGHIHQATTQTAPRVAVETTTAAKKVVAIGTFDGVHRGHRAILDQARAIAGPEGTVVALTFWPHPMAVLQRKKAPALLCGISDRVALLHDSGADEVSIVEFTPEVASWTPEQFIERVLGPLQPTSVVVGKNFRFGAGAAADGTRMRELAGGAFDVTVLPLVVDEGAVSSSRVREALTMGDMATATHILGRPFRFSGIVVLGDQRGRTLGFPTANLTVPPAFACVADGVYAGYLNHGGERWPAAISVGTNPTFEGLQRRVEAYALDRSDLKLYGERVGVDFVARLRGQMRFYAVSDLVNQMKVDVATTREML